MLETEGFYPRKQYHPFYPMKIEIFLTQSDHASFLFKIFNDSPAAAAAIYFFIHYLLPLLIQTLNLDILKFHKQNICFHIHHQDHVISLEECPIISFSMSTPLTSSLQPQILPKYVLSKSKSPLTILDQGQLHTFTTSIQNMRASLSFRITKTLHLNLITLIRLYYVFTQFFLYWILTGAVTYASL